MPAAVGAHPEPVMQPLNPWLIESLIRERRRELELKANRARMRAEARQDRQAQPPSYKRASHPAGMLGRLVFHLRWRSQGRSLLGDGQRR
jgi:hypothetical protein